MVDGALAGLLPGSVSLDSDLRAVMRVLTTQMGLVMRTVALPAMAPAIIDSMVVSFFEARPDLMAAFSKPARVHSYPGALHPLVSRAPTLLPLSHATHSNSRQSW